MTRTPDYTQLDGPALLAALGDNAQKWAEAFCQHYNVEGGPDVAYMATWFANAIEHAHGVREARQQEQRAELREALAVICRVHTRDDPDVGFLVCSSALPGDNTVGLPITPHQYIAALGVLRKTLGWPYLARGEKDE